MAANRDSAERKILVVDDNQHALRAMSDLLKVKGYAVLTARNGAEGLNRMKSDDHISLVLLDLWMPLMDGWEFLRRKKGDRRIADVPVVVLSAIPPVSIDGAGAVLKKPVDLGPLMDAIGRYPQLRH